MTAEIVRQEKQKRFIDAMCAAADGRPLTTFQRNLLLQVMQRLIEGGDAAELVGATRPDGRPQRDHTMMVTHYHALLRTGLKPKQARGVVAVAWKLSDESVRQAERKLRGIAKETLQIWGDDIPRLIRHCQAAAKRVEK